MQIPFDAHARRFTNANRSCDRVAGAPARMLPCFARRTQRKTHVGITNGAARHGRDSARLDPDQPRDIADFDQEGGIDMSRATPACRRVDQSCELLHGIGTLGSLFEIPELTIR